ncbi:hypothetical protein F3087_15830 [Nocardia colli]|uniref:Uncharacterized protein n=1 Tax=Nocardia colli TaxID=2545717 RepID=A0A5N0EGG0_9NOCA|nr:hypothetical protein [Nocardia colli]KAA8888478.1 hypothetical protein F3087_15830 [Nocardia colli]
MRTSKVLVGSAMAVAAAMQIGLGGIASAGEGEALSVSGVAVDSNGTTMTVLVGYTCAENSKHTMLSVVVAEDGEKGVTGTGTAKVDKSTCDGSAQQAMVKVEADTDADDKQLKWTKPGKGTVTVSFSDDIQFNTKTSGLQWVSGKGA